MDLNHKLSLAEQSILPEDAVEVGERAVVGSFSNARLTSRTRTLGAL